MGRIKRSITHWTAGGGRANSLDLKHYHRITEFDGRVVEGMEEIKDNIVTSDGDYARHTLNLNTESAGFAMAGMMGAVESPFDPGPAPLTRRQFEAHCKMLAEFHQAYGIPVTPTACITHAEVEPTLGVKQNGKWDITRLPFEPTIRGAIPVGNYMRERVRAYMQGKAPVLDMNRPTLRHGDRGAFVLDAQDMLVSAGFFLGKKDGIFGPATKAAVMAFQDHAGLATDGVIGPLTWAALLAHRGRKPDREISTQSLRERGSRTISTADSAETAAKRAGAGAVALGGLEVGLDLAERMTAASDRLSAVYGTVLANWPVLLIMGLGCAAYFYGPRFAEAIRNFRTEDARTGRNMGR